MISSDLSLSRRITACVLAVLIPLQSLAQIAPVNGRTTTGQSTAGTTVVNIAAPNAAGVSHNQYQQFNVGSAGLILNNAQRDSAARLGGTVAGNANLGGGMANLIVNEVVGVGRSQLSGYTEVLGAAADVVVANPNGITCNGCGFVNTPRVTLSTGTPGFSAGGALVGFSVRDGDILISGKGLDASRQTAFDILARRVRIDGQINVGDASTGTVGDLLIVGGQQNFEYASRTAGVPVNSSGQVGASEFLIDSSVLGGIYADRIRLIANAQGAGVRVAGNMAALGSDLTITAAGRIELSAGLSAQRDLVANGGSLMIDLADSSKWLHAGRDIALTASGDVQLGGGSLDARGNLVLRAFRLLDTGTADGQRVGAAGVDAQTTGAMAFADALWGGASLKFSANSIEANGATFQADDAAGSLVLQSSGALWLRDSQVYGNGNVGIGGASLMLGERGVIAAGKTLQADFGSNLDNAGLIHANGPLRLMGASPAATLLNRESGALVSKGALGIGAAGGKLASVRNDGSLSGSPLTIDALSLINHGTTAAQLTLATGDGSISLSGNGTKVVNIAAPNGAGVSHNRFLDFNVDGNGLVLNNSRIDAVSLLGGGVVANRQLGGSAAGLILNEVVSSNRSQLNGYTEVLGPAAEVVIANPNGITCSGCGFLNTPRVSIVAGTPDWMGGGLNGFTVLGGDVTIGGRGLDATGQSTFDILARTVAVDGQINVGRPAASGSAGSGAVFGNLGIVGGAERFDYLTRSAQALAGSGPAPGFVIDTGRLGGIYADRIGLVATEQGTGVRTAGDLGASGDDLRIAASGRIEVSGQASAARDIRLSGGQIAIDQNSSAKWVYAGRDLQIVTPGGVFLGKGNVAAGGALAIQAGSLEDIGSASDARFATGATSVTVAGAATFDRAVWGGGSFSLLADTLDSRGASFYASDAAAMLDMTASGVLGLGGSALSARGAINLAGEHIALGAQGAVVTDGDVRLRFASAVDNAGTIQAKGGVGLRSASAGGITNRAGAVIISGGSLSVASGGGNLDLVNQGLMAGETVSVVANEVVNRDGGVLQGGSSFNIVANRLSNLGRDAFILGTTSSNGGTVMNVPTVINEGQIHTRGDLYFPQLTSLTQRWATGAVEAPMIGAARDLDFNFMSPTVLGVGSLQAGRNLRIAAPALSDNGDFVSVQTSTCDPNFGLCAPPTVVTREWATRTAGGTLSVVVGGDLRLGGGQYVADGDLSLSAAMISLGQQANGQSTANRVGIYGALGSGIVSVQSQDWIKLGNVDLYSGHALSLSTPRPLLVEQEASVQSGTDMALSFGPATGIFHQGQIETRSYLNNAGTLFAGGRTTLSSSAGLPISVDNSGILGGVSALVLGSVAQPADILNQATGQVLGGDFSLVLRDLTNFGLVQDVSSHLSSLSAQNLVNQSGGRILSYDAVGGNGKLDLAADSLENHGLIYSGRSLAEISAGRLINHEGAGIGTGGSLFLTSKAGDTPIVPAAPTLLNLGDIFGLNLFFSYGYVVNGVDPGLTANQGRQRAAIRAVGRIAGTALARMDNFGEMSSQTDDIFLSLYGDFNNRMSAPPTSFGAASPYFGSTRGDYGNTSDSGAKISYTKSGTSEDYYVWTVAVSTRAYQDVIQYFTQDEHFDFTPLAPNVFAGRDLVIRTQGNVNNIGGSLAASRDANITANQFTNQSLDLTRKTFKRLSTDKLSCFTFGPSGEKINDPGCTPKSIEQYDIASSGLNESTTLDSTTTLPAANSLRAVAFAGNSFTFNGNSFSNIGSATAPGTALPPAALQVAGPGAKSSPVVTVNGSTSITVNGATVILPTTQNGQFVPVQNSRSRYLVETNPVFGLEAPTLGSDFLAGKLGLDPETLVKRLADANYENYLIQQQILAQTGASLLASAYDSYDMAQLLFTNAADAAKDFKLTYGKALTSEQVAALKEDIVWMVESEVQGQKVLVPVVYLSDATRQSIGSGAQVVSGNGINIDAGTIRNAGASISAGGLVNLKSRGDIENISGRISGSTVVLDARGNVVNRTLTAYRGDADNGRTEIGEIAAITAAKLLYAKAGKDISSQGGRLDSGGDLALDAAGKVNLESLVLENRRTFGRNGSENFSARTGQTALEQTVSARGNIVVRGGGDVNIVGASVRSDEGTTLLRSERGNVNIGVLELKSTQRSAESLNGVGSEGGADGRSRTIATVTGAEEQKSSREVRETTGYGSRVSGKGVVVTTGAGDVNVIGSDLRSGKDGTVIDSARDVNVTAYYDQRSDTRRDELHRQGIATDVNADGVHIGLREKGQIEETTVSSREARTSSLSSDGGVSISAGRTLTNEGTKIRAAGDIVLEAEDIINKAAHNEYATTTARTDYDLRQQAGLSANGSGQSISDAVDGRSKQVNIGTPEAQLRVKVDVTQSTDTTAQSNAVVTDLRAGGNIVVKARNTASDEGSRYDAQQNVVIDAAAYESRAAANTSASAHGDTQTSSTATGGVNLSAQATFNANSSGSSTQSSSTRSKAVVGTIKGGGAVRIRTDKDLTLEGTNVSGEKGVGLTAGGDLKLLQAQDSSDTRSATQSGDARVSVAVSLVGTSGSVGVGAHGREEESRDRQTTGIAGNIKSGSGNVDLVAGRDMTLQGTNIGAKGDVGLDAKGKIDYQAAVSTREKTGRIDGGGGSVDVSYGASGGNKSMGANVSADFDRGRTDYRERTETGGRVNAGGTFTLKSGGDARLQGSEVKAATADVTVGGNLTMESARRTVKEDSSRVSGIVNVGGSKGGGAQMANTGGQAGSSGNSFGADAQVKVDISKQDIERNSNASITTSGRTTLNVKGNATLAGANVEAGGGVKADIGGDLKVESRVDRERVDKTKVTAYAGMAQTEAPKKGRNAGQGSFDKVQDKGGQALNQVGTTGAFTSGEVTKKDNLSVGRASGFSGGSGGLDVSVGGNTTLVGAANQGTDFKTVGSTISSAVETRSKESHQQFRVAGTVASIAGSDEGKGGTYSANVRTPARRAAPGDSAAPGRGAPGEAPVRPSRRRVEDRAIADDGGGRVAAPRGAPQVRGMASVDLPGARDSNGLPARPNAPRVGEGEGLGRRSAPDMPSPPVRSLSEPALPLRGMGGPTVDRPSPLSASLDARRRDAVADPQGARPQGPMADSGAMPARQPGSDYGNAPGSVRQEPPVNPRNQVDGNYGNAPIGRPPVADGDGVPRRPASDAMDRGVPHNPVADTYANDAGRLRPTVIGNAVAVRSIPEAPAEGNPPRIPDGNDREGVAAPLARQPMGDEVALQPRPAPRIDPEEMVAAAVRHSEQSAAHRRALDSGKSAAEIGAELEPVLRARNDNSGEDKDRAVIRSNVASITRYAEQAEGEGGRQLAVARDLMLRLQESLAGPRVDDEGNHIIPLQPKYVGENVPGLDNWLKQAIKDRGREPDERKAISYFDSPEDRMRNRLVMSDGRLLDANGNSLGDRHLIFVVDRNGNLYATESRPEVIHHSSLLGGEPVSMAGELLFRNGKLSEISSQSGHYRPSEAAFNAFLKRLAGTGMDLEGVGAYHVQVTTNAINGRFDSSIDRTRNLLDAHRAAPAIEAGEHLERSRAASQGVSRIRPASEVQVAPGDDRQPAADSYGNAPNVLGQAAEGASNRPPMRAFVGQHRAIPAVGNEDAYVGIREGAEASVPIPRAQGNAAVGLGDEATGARPRAPSRDDGAPAGDTLPAALIEKSRSHQRNGFGAEDREMARDNIDRIDRLADGEARAALLGRLSRSMETQPRDKNGVPMTPIMPQYIGEDLPGFDSWYKRNIEKTSAPGSTRPEGWQTRSVKYLTPDERGAYEVKVDRSGKLVYANGVRAGRSPDGKGPLMFVVDGDGRMYAGTMEVGAFHHSSFLAGEPVSMAGELVLNRNGVITEMTNKSGHYRPTTEQYVAFVSTLVNVHGVAPRFAAKHVDISTNERGQMVSGDGTDIYGTVAHATGDMTEVTARVRNVLDIMAEVRAPARARQPRPASNVYESVREDKALPDGYRGGRPAKARPREEEEIPLRRGGARTEPLAPAPTGLAEGSAEVRRKPSNSAYAEVPDIRRGWRESRPGSDSYGEHPLSLRSVDGRRGSNPALGGDVPGGEGAVIRNKSSGNGYAEVPELRRSRSTSLSGSESEGEDVGALTGRRTGPTGARVVRAADGYADPDPSRDRSGGESDAYSDGPGSPRASRSPSMSDTDDSGDEGRPRHLPDYDWARGMPDSPAHIRQQISRFSRVGFAEDDRRLTDATIQRVESMTDRSDQAVLLTRLSETLAPAPLDRQGRPMARLMPQHIGEDVDGFENWFQRNMAETDPAGTALGNWKNSVVKYLTVEERADAEVAMDRSGRLVFVRGDRQGEPPIIGGKAIFVVDAEGRIYAGEPWAGKFHHSSFLAGEPVSMAGEFVLDTQGRLVEITNQSGHYRPTLEQYVSFLRDLAPNLEGRPGIVARAVTLTTNAQGRFAIRSMGDILPDVRRQEGSVEEVVAALSKASAAEREPGKPLPVPQGSLDPKEPRSLRPRAGTDYSEIPDRPPEILPEPPKQAPSNGSLLDDEAWAPRVGTMRFADGEPIRKRAYSRLGGHALPVLLPHFLVSTAAVHRAMRV